MNHSDRMHPQTREILNLMPDFKDNLESGGTSAKALADKHGWKYTRLLHWLKKMCIIDFVTGRYYGESKKEYELRKQREKICVEAYASPEAKDTIRRLNDTINKLGEELRKRQREVESLKTRNMGLRARLSRYEDVIL